ncbi:hypothetical protein GAGA_3437 [Paraglaciecola agarilytica NO2]|uniref:Uncharacterized protein n=1 Tax=Paraglaciecola agarilytica NO2 TaxID=1125747 RepID=A0ABQ0IA67_9ALTE|nr:hypothetical protein GAGA_3437 [Paraglaciecola agarilytica NO2]
MCCSRLHFGEANAGLATSCFLNNHIQKPEVVVQIGPLAFGE